MMFQFSTVGNKRSDVETSLYYCNSRYYNPEWGRWLNAGEVSELNPQSINGLNLFAYCANNPVMSKHGPILGGSTVVSSSITGGSIASNKIIARIIARKLNISKSSFNLFGAELRTSTGWDSSPDIATSHFGRIGFSSYITHTRGQSEMFYAFAGSTSDIMNWFSKTYYAGVGVNLFDIVGAEVQLETVGVGAQVNIGRFSVGVNINLIGGTSITFGWDTDLGNGSTRTDGFTIGVNTGFLVASVYWVYKFLKTGDPSPVPGLQPGLSY